jgi:hypothetical protein
LQETLPLFDNPAPDLKIQLADRLRHLAADKLFVGASSWKYEGWLGQIYSPERYFTKGRFSACWRRSVRVPFPRADQRQAANSGWRHWRALAGGSLIDKPHGSPAQGLRFALPTVR